MTSSVRNEASWQLRSAPAFLVHGLAWLGAWTAIALLFTLYVMLPSPAAGAPGEWARAAAWQLVSWWSWAAVTPSVIAVSRYLVNVRPWHRLLAAHLAVGIVLSGLCSALQGLARWVIFRGVRVRYDIAGASSLPLADEWSFNLVVYAMVVGVFFALRSFRLESQLARAHLDALSARLQPHFLFNTLNSISALVLDDPRTANKMLVRLSELLRQAFARPDSIQVSLEEELRLLDHFVVIQKHRYGDRLSVALDVEPGAELGLVPALLFQPLVENAVSHGLSRRDGAGSVTVTVSARRHGRRLRLVVQDDGPGFDDRAERVPGLGLAGTRARLAEQYGTDSSMHLANAPGGGAEVTIEIPFVSDARTDR